MRALCIIVAALALCSCAAVKPQKGGGSTTTLGGANAPTVVTSASPENPETPTTTTTEKTIEREYAEPVFTQDRSAEDHLIHNQEAAGSNPAPAPTLPETQPSRLTAGPQNSTDPSRTVTRSAAPAVSGSTPRLLRERVHEKSTTSVGTAQKDTARDLGVRLANMRGVMWVGVALLIGGPLVGWKMGWFTNGCIAGATGLGLIILAQILPGNEAWFGLGGLLLIPVIAFVYYRAHHDARSEKPDGQT